MKNALRRMVDFLSRFYDSPEGHIFFFGLIAAFIFSTLMVSIAIAFQNGGRLLSIIVFYLAAGRLGGISRGLQIENHAVIVFLLILALDMLMVMLIYPLAIFSTKEVISLRRVQRAFGRMFQAADRYFEPIRHWGVPGLIIINWLPISFTGPIVSAILGWLLGFSHRLTLTIVLLGSAFAIITWIWLINPLLATAAEMSFLVPLAIVGVFLFFNLLHRMQQRKINRRQDQPE